MNITNVKIFLYPTLENHCEEYFISENKNTLPYSSVPRTVSYKFRLNPYQVVTFNAGSFKEAEEFQQNYFINGMGYIYGLID